MRFVTAFLGVWNGATEWVNGRFNILKVFSRGAEMLEMLLTVHHFPGTVCLFHFFRLELLIGDILQLERL